MATLTGGEAILLATPELDIINYSAEVTFPTGSSTHKAGIVFAHDGTDNYYAVVLDRQAGKIALHQITSGSWGSALGSAAATINDSTAYTVRVDRKQSQVHAWVVGQSTADFTYDSSSDFGTGQSGFYSNKTSVTFDDAKFWHAVARDPYVPRIVGAANAVQFCQAPVGASAGAAVESVVDPLDESAPAAGRHPSGES